LELTNIIASFYPEMKRRLILCAHWDTRPFADKDSNPENRSQPILGANDGASGVALLLEIASLLPTKKPKWGVDIVFFDGEDYGSEGRYDMYCLGSQFFSKNLGDYHPEFGILLDLIGDENLEIYREGYSDRHAKHIVDLIWSKAKELNSVSFRDSIKHWVLDDHLPLIGVGIPCVDLIDLDYPYWHTLEDTPDKCSPRSLKEVGEVILKILYE
jgi:glutaminyl-peptide cyclotransferase